MKAGTPHPNEALAAEGWKFVNSMESIFFILQLVTRILKYKCKEWQQLL